jgi:type II secretory pathway pseudopilin PulG
MSRTIHFVKLGWGGKRGVVLLLALVVFLILSVLAAAFFTRTISENNLVRRYVSSTQALWYAEEGLAEATRQLDSTTSLGCLVSPCHYNTTTIDEGSGLYRITSTGRVFVGTSPINRTVESYVALNLTAGGDFNRAIEVRGNLSLKGSIDINPDPPENYADDYANFTFSERFGCSSDQIKYAAMSGQEHFTYLDEADLTKPKTQLDYTEGNVTWIELTSDKPPKVQLPNPGSGSGIIIINSPYGNVDIEGGDFNGIIWVIGELKIAGITNVTGSILSECAVDVETTASGNANLTWDPTAIQNALNLTIDLAPRTAKSWRELP